MPRGLTHLLEGKFCMLNRLFLLKCYYYYYLFFWCSECFYCQATLRKDETTDFNTLIKLFLSLENFITALKALYTPHPPPLSDVKSHQKFRQRFIQSSKLLSRTHTCTHAHRQTLLILPS